MKSRVRFAVVLVVAIISMLALAVTGYARNESYESYDLVLLQEGGFPTAYKAEYDTDSIRADIEAALEEKAGSIAVNHPQMQTADVAGLYEDVINNAPQLGYVEGRVDIEKIADGEYIIYPVYKNEAKLLASDANEIVQQAIDDILAQVKPGMSDTEKVLAVHDYIVLNYEYDHTYSVYSSDNFFYRKRGVCQAYSLAMKYILNELDIKSVVVSSSDMNHAWNMVQIDGEWYHLDATWDDPNLYYSGGYGDSYGYVAHKYFLLSDDAISDDLHEHYGWETNYEATSDFYDDYFWAGIRTPIQYYNGVWYWGTDRAQMHNGVSLAGGIGRYDFSNDVAENLFENYSITGMSVYNDYIYYLYDDTVVYMAPIDDIQSPVEITSVEEYDNLNGIYLDGYNLRYATTDPEYYEKDEQGIAIYDDYYEYREYHTINLSSYKYDDYVINWTYEDGVLTVGCKKGIIPDYKWDFKAPWDVYSDEITSIVIEDNIKEIGAYAFAGLTAVQEVHFPSALRTIREFAFYECESLHTLEIPDSVKNIGRYAFAYCYELKNLKLPAGLTGIEARTFYCCESLETVEIPDSVATIGDLAFGYCFSLESMRIPESVTALGDEVFFNCYYLRMIYIPDSVTSIGEEVFSYGSSQLTIYCNEGSYAQTYAEENGFSLLIPTDGEYADIRVETVEAAYNSGDETVVVSVKMWNENENGTVMADVYAAAYADGKLIGIKKMMPFIALSYSDEMVMSGCSQKPDYVKVFVFDEADGVAPLCEVQQKEL